MNPVNLQMLWDTADGDAAFACELAELYLAQTAEQMELLREALSERSAPRVESIAHRCKGGSLACGVVILGSLFRQLEQFGHDGRLDEAERLSVEIGDEFTRVQTVLHALPPRAEHLGTQA